MAVAAPGLGGRGSTAVADTVAVAVSAQVGDDDTDVVEENIEKLKAEKLALLVELIAEKTPCACALLNSVRLQRNIKKMVEEKRRLRG